MTELREKVLSVNQAFRLVRSILHQQWTKKSPSKLSDQHPGNEFPLLAGKEGKPKLDLKETGKVQLKGNMSRQFHAEKRQVKSKKAGMLRSDILHRKIKTVCGSFVLLLLSSKTSRNTRGEFRQNFV